MKHPWWCLVFFALVDAPSAGQEASIPPASNVSLEARVLFVSGRRVQIDLGVETGIQAGDRVRFRPLGRPEILGQVRSVLEHSSWVELPLADHGVDLGTVATVRISQSPSPPSDRAHLWGEDPRLPDDPPRWSAPDDAWDPSQPLLTDRPRSSSARPTEWHGSWYAWVDTFREREALDQSSRFARTGLDLTGLNPFGAGGRFELAFDLDQRALDSDSSLDRNQTRARIDRLSYRWGGDRDHPSQWQVGRFLPSSFPEFGILDGIEWVHRFNGDTRISSSLGFLPETNQDFTTGADLQWSLGLRSFVGTEHRLQWAAAYQHSWHHGDPDRDLVVLQADYLPGSRFSWRNSAWIDVYGKGDRSKASGPELTLWNTHLLWQDDDQGAGLALRHWRFPELLRFQGGFFFDDRLANARTTRLDGDSWWRLNARWRLSVRGNAWTAEQGDGLGADLRLDHHGWLEPGDRSWCVAYRQQGADQDATGIRLGHDLPLAGGRLRLAADSARFRFRDEDHSLGQHELRLGWERHARSGWTLSLDVGRRIGDDQDGVSLALFLSRLF